MIVEVKLDLPDDVADQIEPGELLLTLRQMEDRGHGKVATIAARGNYYRNTDNIVMIKLAGQVRLFREKMWKNKKPT